MEKYEKPVMEVVEFENDAVMLDCSTDCVYQGPEDCIEE